MCSREYIYVHVLHVQSLVTLIRKQQPPSALNTMVFSSITNYTLPSSYIQSDITVAVGIHIAAGHQFFKV